MLRNLSLWHLLILLAVVFLVFGIRRLPEIGSGLGKGIREFKKGIKEDSDAEVEGSTPDRDPKRLSE